jgi:hypothetical protein
MTMIRKSMIALGAMAVIMAGATPTLARDTSARHFGYGAFAYYGPSYSYGQRSRNYPPAAYPPAAVRPMITWDSYGLRWDSAKLQPLSMRGFRLSRKAAEWGIAVFAVQHFLHTSFAICAGLPRINEASHTVAAVQHQVFRSARCSCVCDAPTEEAL